MSQKFFLKEAELSQNTLICHFFEKFLNNYPTEMFSKYNLDS